MADDVVVNKCAAIEQAVQRIRVLYDGNPAALREDLMRQEAIVLNLQRACQSAIDLAMHVVRARQLGLPRESREAFALLVEAGMVPDTLGERMKRMVGFRNVAVHQYHELSLAVVQAVLDRHLEDFEAFTRLVLRSSRAPE